MASAVAGSSCPHRKVWLSGRCAREMPTSLASQCFCEERGQRKQWQNIRGEASITWSCELERRACRNARSMLRGSHTGSGTRTEDATLRLHNTRPDRCNKLMQTAPHDAQSESTLLLRRPVAVVKVVRCQITTNNNLSPRCGRGFRMDSESLHTKPLSSWTKAAALSKHTGRGACMDTASCDNGTSITRPAVYQCICSTPQPREQSERLMVM